MRLTIALFILVAFPGLTYSEPEPLAEIGIYVDPGRPLRSVGPDEESQEEALSTLNALFFQPLFGGTLTVKPDIGYGASAAGENPFVYAFRPTLSEETIKKFDLVEIASFDLRPAVSYKLVLYRGRKQSAKFDGLVKAFSTLMAVLYKQGKLNELKAVTTPLSGAK